MYNPKEYWKNELGGESAWIRDAEMSPNIPQSIDRLQKTVIPKIKELKKAVGGNVLDAGCGCGYCINQFKLSGLWTGHYGIDFQEHRIRYCKTKHSGQNIDFRVGNLGELPYEDSFFDMIYTGSVFIHLPVEDKIKTIKEFKRVLTDDGFYFGHEIIDKSENEISDSGFHVINTNMEWLRKQFDPFIVEEIMLYQDNWSAQIIYAHK